MFFWNELLELQLMGTDGKPKAEGEGWRYHALERFSHIW